MDAREMQYQTELKLKQLDSVGDRPFTTSDIEDLLNEAQRIYVRQNYEVFETSERVRKVLDELLGNANITPTSSSNTNLDYGVFVTLPSDFMYSIEEMATINLDTNGQVTTSAASYTKVPVKPVTYDEYAVNIDNPYKKPYRKLVWRLDYQKSTYKRHELITDGTFSVITYHLRYLKFPSDIVISSNTSCALSDITHDDIVNLAVNLTLKDNKK